ncbi:MAG: HAD family hydrolase [Chloroflexota bacterium]|jgi:pyrophosphatase PpaX
MRLSAKEHCSNRLPLRYLLFDLDGTLVDTTELILNCYRAAIFDLVDSPPSDEEITKGFGTPTRDQLWRLFPSLRHRIDELEAMWKDAYQSLHDQLVKPFPDTVEVLKGLRERGYPLGIVTSKVRSDVERVLPMFDLEGLLDVVVSVDDTTKHKPHPEPVLKGMELMSAHPSETLYVGDSLSDMKAGREAGTRVAAAMWGPCPKKLLLDFGPDYTLSSIRDLLNICPGVE